MLFLPETTLPPRVHMPPLSSHSYTLGSSFSWEAFPDLLTLATLPTAYSAFPWHTHHMQKLSDLWDGYCFAAPTDIKQQGPS